MLLVGRGFQFPPRFASLPSNHNSASRTDYDGIDFIQILQNFPTFADWVEVVRLEEWLSQGNFLFGGIKLPNLPSQSAEIWFSMEWDLINYFSEKLYIEHKNQSLTLSTDFIKEKVFSLRVHQTLKTTTNREIEIAKLFWSNPNWPQPSPPHSIQWSVISPRHFLPRPLLSNRNGAKTIFWNQFPGTVKYESFSKMPKGLKT